MVSLLELKLVVLFGLFLPIVIVCCGTIDKSLLFMYVLMACILVKPENCRFELFPFTWVLGVLTLLFVCVFREVVLSVMGQFVFTGEFVLCDTDFLFLWEWRSIGLRFIVCLRSAFWGEAVSSD